MRSSRNCPGVRGTISHRRKREWDPPPAKLQEQLEKVKQVTGEGFKLIDTAMNDVHQKISAQRRVKIPKWIIRKRKVRQEDKERKA